MRRISWFLALLLAAGVLAAAGCGGDDEEEPAAGGGGATTTEETPEPTETPEATETPEEEDGGGGGDGGGGETLTLTADPGGSISWEPSELNAAAGEVSIELVNDSTTPHAVEVEGQGVEEESETITESTTTLTVDLEAGEYVFYCPVGQHRQNGMEGQLLVE
jgi:plastocyanin